MTTKPEDKKLESTKPMALKLSVSQAIQELALSKANWNVLVDNEEVWATFGRKDSHMLRAKLFKIFREEKMSPDSIMFVFILFAAIKNQVRVLEHMDALPENIKGLSHFTTTKDFISKRLVQYVSQETFTKFAVVHLPTTMPGLDVLLTAKMFSKSDENLDLLKGKQTFAQLYLSTEMQSINKAKQIDFWNNVVTASKNPNSDQKGKKLGFVEEYYNTSANDKYLMLDENLKEVQPSNQTLGYTEGDIKKWYDSLSWAVKKEVEGKDTKKEDKK